MIQAQKNSSEYGLEMPEELAMVLEQDEEAKSYFDELTKSKQRSLIYIVLKVKNTDSRVRKALTIAAHLQQSKGTLDFKKLNEWTKYYNNKII